MIIISFLGDILSSAPPNRKKEIKTLIEDETIKGTIKKSFEFSEKSNINELQEAISEALKRNDVVEAQKLMDILKKITDEKK